MRRTAAWLVSVLAVACGGGTPDLSPPVVPPDEDAARCGGQPCKNVVDRVVIPMLLTSGRTVNVESTAALCRRLSVDLNGVLPSANELETACSGRTPRELVSYFMDKPSAPHIPGAIAPYRYVSRRLWSEVLSYRTIPNDLTTTFFGDVLSMDQLVDRMVAGDIGYDTFVVETLAHPSFIRRFGLFNTQPDPTLVAAAAIKIFLGREALPSESADFGNLFRPYSLKLISTQQELVKSHPACAMGGGTGTINGASCLHYAPTVRGGACKDTEALLCQSTVFGPAQLSFSTPLGTLTRFFELTGSDADMLRVPGRLLIKRREFAEAIVDRTLSRYLGWWNAGVYRPDYNLPAVRDALVDYFIAHNYRVRDLETEILTSVLYTQPQRLRDGDIPEAPLWTVGPTKPLLAEVFLDSLGSDIGTGLGGCDFRYNAILGTVYEGRVKPPEAFVYRVDFGVEANFYGTYARRLGGCPVGERGEASGLVPAQAKREALIRLCNSAAAQNNLIPVLSGDLSSREALSQIFQKQLFALFGRSATAAELADFLSIAESEACPAGSCDYKQVGSQLCMALFSSSLFNFY